MVQRFLEPTFMDKNFNGCLRNTLAACFAFASEFGRFGATLFFLDVHVVCQQQQTNLFFCQTAFYIFWKLRDVFQLFHGQGERFWNL